ncbi:alpha/beta fold hydrolase [Rhodococcus aetherivorans]|uniref:alpha/beta fold hydrolase n=1 Tax=Rhodococcus aetherivorans TaxID=191292 RepID=UPI0035EF4A3C
MRSANTSPEHAGASTFVAVVLPGTGSDARFVERAFGGPLAAAGIRAVAVDPDPARVVGSYVDALERAATDGPVLVGGVSLGAAVALRWAAEHPGRTVGVLAALPAWTGSPEAAPAAASARWTAGELRAHGLAAVTAAMVASSPAWLGVELARSWRSQWPGLPAALDEASRYRAPDRDELRTVEVPVGIAAAVDDPVHPLAVAQEWCAHLRRAALGTVTLAGIGGDPAVLGATCLEALASVSGGRDRPARAAGTIKSS